MAKATCSVELFGIRYNICWMTAEEVAKYREEIPVDPRTGLTYTGDDGGDGWYHWEGDADLDTGHWDCMQGPFDKFADAYGMVQEWANL